MKMKYIYLSYNKLLIYLNNKNSNWKDQILLISNSQRVVNKSHDY